MASLTQKEKDTIKKLQGDFARAQRLGDNAGMRKAHEEADKIRGYETTTVTKDGRYIQAPTKELWKNVSRREEPVLTALSPRELNADSLVRAQRAAELRKEAGIPYRPQSTAPKAFVPELTSRRDTYLDRRDEAAGNKKDLPPLNINIIPQEKMDSTARQTILSKAHKDALKGFNFIDDKDQPVSTTSRLQQMYGINQPQQEQQEPTIPMQGAYNPNDPFNVAMNDPKRKENFVSKNIWKGVSGASSAIMSTLDWILPNELAGKYDVLEPVFNYYRKADENNQYKTDAANDTKVKEVTGQLISGTVQALPSAILALASGGTSIIGQAAGTSLANANKVSTLGTALQGAVKELGKNPMFWTSFLQMAGPTYEEEIANGSSEVQASASAMLNGILGSAIEVSGGLETFKWADKGWKKLLTSALEEGGEEISQYSLQNLINKAIGSDTAKWASLNPEESAVVNPLAQLEQGAYGAAIGGILGGGQQAFVSGVNKANDIRSRSNGGKIPVIQPDGRIKYQEAPTSSSTESDGILFRDLGLKEEYTPENVSEMNMGLYSKAEEVFNIMNEARTNGIESIDADKLRILNESNDLFKNAIDNRFIVEKAKPYYDQMSREIDNILTQGNTHRVSEPAPTSSVQPQTPGVDMTEPMQTENTLENVGKKQGNNVSIHKSYEDSVSNNSITQAKEKAGNPDYDIIRVNQKNGDISFIKTDNFNNNTEPLITSIVTVTKDGNVKTENPEGKVIIDKAKYVPDDYSGFDVQAAQERETAWRRSGVNYDSTQIENKEYFDNHLRNVGLLTEIEADTTPLSDENIQDNQILDTVSEPISTQAVEPQNDKENKATAGNTGVHFGDLGKTEYLMTMNGSRDTGHFGTGTYFVSPESDAIPRMTKNSYGKRPRHEVSLEGYNLYVPKDVQQGRELHELLKQVNKWAFGNKRYRDSIADMYINSAKLFDNAFVSETEVEDYLAELQDYVSENKAKDEKAYFDKTERYDSPSTKFMKYLGYDGVDVRGLKGLDDEEFGSVVYNLKGEPQSKPSPEVVYAPQTNESAPHKETPDRKPSEAQSASTEPDASNEAVKWIDKVPKGFTWENALVQKDGGHAYNKLSFKEHGDDLYVRFQGNNLKQKIVAIKDFRNVRATDLFNMEGQPFDTRHFNDGILKIWDQNDLDFGYVEKITKPIAKPIESSENKADNEVEAVPDSLMNELVAIIGEDVIGKGPALKEMKDTLTDVYNNSDNLDYSYNVLIKSIGNLATTEKISNDISNLTRTIRNAKIKISDDMRSNIPDFNDFRKRNLVYIRLANEGSNIDTFYAELVELYPEYFSDEVTHPADQLELIVDTVKRLSTDGKKTYKMSDVLSEADISSIYILPIIDTMQEYKKGGNVDERQTERAIEQDGPTEETQRGTIESDANAGKEAEGSREKVQKPKVKTEKDGNIEIEQDQSKKVRTVLQIPSNELSTTQLVQRIKSYERDRQAGYSRFVQERNLKPEIDASEFFEIWDSVSANPYNTAETKEFTPTHINKSTGGRVMVTDNGNSYDILFENGSTGGSPKNLLDDFFEPINNDIERGAENETEVQGISRGISGRAESEVLQQTETGRGTGKLPEQNERMGGDDAQPDTSKRDGQKNEPKGKTERDDGETSGTRTSEYDGGRSDKRDARATSEGYRITDIDLDKGGKVQRYNQNVAAIKLLKTLESENRNATVDEMEVLAKFSGWGGLKEAFIDNKDKAWQDRADEIKELLTKEQYRSAASSTEDAFYTPINVINSMYDIVKAIGVTNNSKILEPSSGTGYFIGAMPDGMRKSSKITGIEIDSITGNIAKYLYPNADIRVQGFEKTDIPKDSLDLIIGNVPFGVKAPYDKNYKQYGKFMIHDYFILKGLDSLKPGGIMSVITTSGTLDKQDSEARKLMSDKANLVAAIRMPSGTFNATDVVADILIFQKKGENVQDLGNEFVNVKGFEDRNGKVFINEYFNLKNNPMILGDVGITTNQFGNKVLSVKDNGRTINDIIDIIPKNLVTKIAEAQAQDAENEINSNPIINEDFDSEDVFVLDGDKIYKKNPDTLELEEWYKVYGKGSKKEGQKELIDPKGKQAQRLRGMLDLHKSFQNVMGVQTRTEDKTALANAQKELNKAYDDFVKKHGAIHSTANKSVFGDDNRYYHLTSLENKEYQGDKIIYEKSNTFTERVVPTSKPITKVKNVSDALVVSLNLNGGVNLDYMSELYNKDKDTVVRELGRAIYELPNSEGSYVTAEEYLSGNVKAKLSEAKEKAKEDNRFERNVEALTEVQPIDLRADEISVNIGTPWVGTKVMGDFANALYDGNAEVSVYYDAYKSYWTFNVKAPSHARSTANQKWGAEGYSVEELLDAISNKKQITVTYKDRHGNSVMDYNATMMARGKADEIKEFFSDWIYKDADRRTTLENYYNENFNNLVERKFDGEFLKMYGVNPKIKLRPHQLSAVARVLYSKDNVLFAHPVGAGKTYAMIGAVQEMKRLGIAQKPLMVVPNHKIGDFMADYYRMYPNAKILTIKGKDFSPANRKRLLTKIQNTNFDCVIMRHSSFEMFPFSPEYQQKYIQNQIDELEEAIRASEEVMDKRTLSNMNKSLDSLKDKLEKALDTPKDATDVFVDTSGIDALIVDEAHNFKNLSYPSKMSRIAGVQNTGSDKATNMHMATSLMNERRNKVIFATATPISNSIGELYTMMRYLEPNMLQEYGINSFDAWAETFGEVVSAVEMNTTGSNLTTKERFAKFKNVPELIKIFKVVADIIDKDSLGLKLPDADYRHITVESNDILHRYNQHLEERKKSMSFEDAKKGGHLLVMQDARMAALDLRTVKNLLMQERIIPYGTTDEELDLPDSKINTAVDTIYNEYINSTETLGTQIVFLDRGTPQGNDKKESEKYRRLMFKNEEELTEAELEYIASVQSGRRYSFDLYEDIKLKLIRKGIPASEIEFIQDTASGDSDNKKSKLFDKVNAGQVRILLGSTAMMGEGMNAQKKAVALHQIDAPMRPSDVEQRIGRVIRQGNDNDKARVYNYSTLNSYDAPTWGMLSRKNKSISQIMLGDESIREIEDLTDDPFANMSIEAANNPLMFERKDVDDKVKKLTFKKKSFMRSRALVQDTIRNYPQNKAYSDGMVKALEDVMAKVKKAPENEYIVDGTIMETLKDASVALKEKVKKIESKTASVEVGSIRGLKVFVSKKSPAEYDVYLEDQDGKLYAKEKAIMSEEDGGYDSEHKTDTVFLRLNNKIERTPARVKDYQAVLENLEKEYNNALKEDKDGNFPEEAKLVEAKKRLAEIDQQLKGDKKPDTPAPEYASEVESEDIQYMKSQYSKVKPAPKLAGQNFAGQIYQSTQQNQFTGKAEGIFANIPKSYKAKTIEEIKANIIRYFVVNIHSKNFRRPKGTLAYFKPKHTVISAKHTQAIGPIAHELGHKLDRDYGFVKTGELKKIWKDAPGYSTEMDLRGYKDDQKSGEVLADFVMMYLTNPNAAYELGGYYSDTKNFYDVFESTLSKKDLQNIRNLQRDILMWGAQDSETKAMGTIVYRSNKKAPTLKQLSDDFMRSFIDSFDGAKLFVDAVEKETGNNISEVNNTYEMLRKTVMAPSIASAILHERLIGPEGFKNGESFISLFKDLKHKDMPRFDLYLKDKHALDWMAAGKRVYSIEMDSEQELKARITRAELEHPEFVQASENLYQWWQDFTKIWLVDTGVMTKELHDTMSELYPHYVPNFREMDGIAGLDSRIKGDPIKRASKDGSDRRTYSAVESLILQVGNIVRSGVQNQAMTTLHTLFENPDYSETVGLFLDRVPSDLQVHNFNAIDLKSAVQDEMFKENWDKMTDQEKADFKNLPIKEQLIRTAEMSNSQIIDRVIADYITYFTPKEKSSDPNTVVAMVNGKPKFYYITDENLARAFMAISPRQIGGIARMVKALTRGFTGLTTANNPLFAIANHVRDIQHGLVMIDSNYHALDPRTYLSYVKDLLVSYGQIVSHTRLARKLGIKESETYATYRANAGMDSKFMPRGDQYNRTMREIHGWRARHRKSKAGNTITTTQNVLASMVDIISDFNGAIEAAPRMIAFNRVYKKGGKTPDALIKAVHASKEATVDFQRRGTATASMATAVPFIGASIAGIDQFRRITATKEAWATKEGRQRLLRAVISQAIPAILMALILNDDEDYNDLQGYIKDGYWLIKYDDGKYIKLPKEREIGAVFGTSFQRIVRNYLQPDLDNQEELKSYLLYALQTFIPAHEIVGTAIFDAINDKTWYGGSIVPMREQDLMRPGYYNEIYDDTTSRLAVGLARILPDVEPLGALNTPRGIEYVIDQLTGGIGDVIIPATSPTNNGMSNELLRRYMTDSVYSNRYSNEAYEILADLNAAKLSANRAGIEYEEAEWQKAFNNTLSGQSDKFITVSDYYAEIRNNNNDQSLTREERDEMNRDIREKINRITKDIVTAYNEGKTPTYSFADVAMDEGAKAIGITEQQYKSLLNKTTGRTSVEQKYALVTSSGLTAEQKAYVSESLLKNKSYDEWGFAYETVSASISVGELVALNDILKPVTEEGSDKYINSKGNETSVSAGSKIEKSGQGKSASMKKKEAIDKANPNADRKTLEALYVIYDVSEKVW